MFRSMKIWDRSLVLVCLAIVIRCASAQSLTILETEPIAQYCGGFNCEVSADGEATGLGWSSSPAFAAAQWVATYNGLLSPGDSATLAAVSFELTPFHPLDPSYSQTRQFWSFNYEVHFSNGSTSLRGPAYFFVLNTCPVGFDIDQPGALVRFNSMGAEWRVHPEAVSVPCVAAYSKLRPAKICCDTTNWFGNPVHGFWGTKRVEDVDYQGSGSNSLRFKRTYRSLGSISSAFSGSTPGFGYFWSHTYGGRVFGIGLDPGNAAHSVGAVRGSGEVIFFTRTGATSNTYKGDLDISHKLVSLRDASSAIVGWHLYTDSNSLETYDANGKLTGIHSADGGVEAISYDPSGRLSTVVDSFGHRLALTYTGDQIDRLTLPDTQSIQYGYSENVSVSAVTYADLTAKGYAYESSLNKQLLTGIIDENGARYATYAYDADGRVLSTTHAEGANAVSLSYFPFGGSNITGPTGSVATASFVSVANSTRLANVSAPCAACGSDSASAFQALNYDSNGNFSSTDDFNGNRTCYSYDLDRNLETVKVEGLATTSACSTFIPNGAALPAISRKTRTNWHPDWRIRIKVAEPRRLTSLIYNGQPDPFNGNGVASCAPSNAVLPDGKPIAVLCKKVEQATTDGNGGQGFAAPLDPNVAARTWSYSYNAQGQILSVSDPLNHVTTYEYYADSTTDHWLGDLKRTTDAAGHATTFEKYNAHGQVLEMTAPNGLVITNTYDSRQRRTTTSAAGRITTHAYDPAGLLIRIDRPDGTNIENTYDNAHRLIKRKDGAGNTVTYTLDAAGNRIAEQFEDAGGMELRRVTRTFDSMNRMRTLTGAAE